MLALSRDCWDLTGGVERGRIYLLLNVVKGIWGVDGETDQDDMGIRVGEWTETVVILLTSGIPQGQLDVLSINFDIGDVVLEDGWDVDLCDLMLATSRRLFRYHVVCRRACCPPRC